MKKLKKIFPLSFKFCNNVGSLILCAILYALMYMVASVVLSVVVSPIISSILGVLLVPIVLLGLIPLIIGFVLCCFGVGAIIGVPLVVIGILIVSVPNIILSWIQAIILNCIWLYATAGFVVAVLAYSGLWGEIKSSKKKEAVATTASDANA